MVTIHVGSPYEFARLDAVAGKSTISVRQLFYLRPSVTTRERGPTDAKGRNEGPVSFGHGII